MDKLRTLVDLLSENDLSRAEIVLEEIIKEKISLKLEEKKIEVSNSVFNEQMNMMVQRMKRHVRTMHPHLAREKNLRDRQKLENKLNAISRKKF